MIPSFVLSPFQILLNNLSDELHERNLHSLIHVCGDLIPGAQRERITTGWDAFIILRQRNIIGSEPEKMANLLAIIKELRPKRKDLVLKIKRHIQDNYEEPDLKDFESSSDNTLAFRDRHVISRPPTSMPPIPQDDCCRVHCPGCTFSCNPCCDACCCWSCGILAILFSLLALLVLLIAWQFKGENLQPIETVLCVVCVLGLLAVFIVILIRYCRARDQLYYEILPTSRHIRTNLASYAASHSWRTSYNSMGQRTESGQSGQSTTASLVTSKASSVLSYPLLPDDIVSDG